MTRPLTLVSCNWKVFSPHFVSHQYIKASLISGDLISRSLKFRDLRNEMSNKIPVIWQFSVVQFELGTTISGVALSKIQPSTYPERFLKHQALAVTRSYSNKPYACKELFIMADEKIYTVTTTKHGNFSL